MICHEVSPPNPHDVIASPDGGPVYYNDFSLNLVGRLDPKTGETKEYKIPQTIPNPPFAPGGEDMEFDSEGNVWIAPTRQDGAAKLDVKTGKVSTWEFPGPLSRKAEFAGPR